MADDDYRAWAGKTYSNGEGVPLIAEKCVSSYSDKNSHRHTCCRHSSHRVGPHLCICGESWGVPA